METKVINKKQTILIDKCPFCKKEISGVSEEQVNSRMFMHKRKHDVEQYKRSKLLKENK